MDSMKRYTSELDAWKAARKPQPDESRPWHRWVPALAGGLALLAVAAIVRWGPILNPPDPLAGAAEVSEAVTVRVVWPEPGAEASGSLSADGRYLSYVEWETGNLALRNLETGENRLLTKRASDDQSYADWNVISLDGKQVAYVWFNREHVRHELRVIGAEGADAGAEPRVLYYHEDVSYIQPMDWFPGGDKILVLLASKDNFNQIVTVSVEDGSLTVIKSLDWRYPRRIRLSPDGRYLIYDLERSQEHRQRDVWLLAADGSRETPLVEHPAEEAVVDWTPDGSRILFTSDRTGRSALWAVRVLDGKPADSPELIKSSVEIGNPIGFGPGGSFYYGQSTGLMDVYVAEIDPDTGKLSGVPSSPIEKFVGRNRQPAWSPNGDSLAYLRGRGTIAIRSIETGVEREVASGFYFLFAISWTPDGGGIVAAGRDKQSRLGIFRVEVESGKVEPLLRTQLEIVVRAQLSPDGKLLHYRLLPDGGPHPLLRRRDLRTGEDRLIYQGDTNHASLSPDGQKLVMRDRDRIGKTAVLKVLPSAGGEPRELLRVTEPEWIGSPEWSPDSRYILFWRKSGDKKKSQPYSMWRIPAEGGEPQQTALAVESQRAFSIHPDGKRIAYTKSEKKTEVWVIENFLPKLKAAK